MPSFAKQEAGKQSWGPGKASVSDPTFLSLYLISLA